MSSDGERKDTFNLVGQEGRIARTSRMIAPKEDIPVARREDILARINEYIKKHEDVTQAMIARQCGLGVSVVSEVVRGVYKRDKADMSKVELDHLRRINNWMELDARRRNVVQDPTFVETSVAREIILVAEIVSETCKIGVVFGPARIGKSFTLEAIEGSDRLGSPVLIRPGEEHKTPKMLCRLFCARFDLPLLLGQYQPTNLG